jgi:hypothetical protein
MRRRAPSLFLTPNLATVLATISFYNLGIFRLENAPADTSGEVMRVVAGSTIPAPSTM